jgi:RNA-binding protein 5/10
VAGLSDLQILNELQHGLSLEGVEEIRLIKDKRTGRHAQLLLCTVH